MEEIQPISSRDNTKVKLARSVRDGRHGGMIFIEGVRLAEEVLRSRLQVHDAFISYELLETDRIRPIVENLRTIGAKIHIVDQKIADSLSDTNNGQGIALLAERPSDLRLESLLCEKGLGLPIVVFLEKIN